MPKVYILTDGGHDYSAAKEYGELVICTRGSIKRDDIAQMHRDLEPILSQGSADDYIVISGLTSLCCVATAIMVEYFGEVHYLIFKDDKYIKKDLILVDPTVQ